MATLNLQMYNMFPDEPFPNGFPYVYRLEQFIFSTAGGNEPQLLCSWRRSQKEPGSSMVSWVTGEAIQLDVVAPYDSDSHLRSGRAYFRPCLPGLANFYASG